MSNEAPEIVFIRRSLHRKTEALHGGVWKIAYADFMTAMMAFFLVMWLINVTDQKTREAVASYFNPIKLAEATTDKKGLRDPLETEKDGKPEGKDSHTTATVTDDKLRGRSDPLDEKFDRQPRYAEAALFEDPYAVLAALVAGSEPDQSADNVGAFETLGQSGEPGLNGGDAQRDPFDPVYWKMSRTPLPADGAESGGADKPSDNAPVGTANAAAEVPATKPAEVVEAKEAVAAEALKTEKVEPVTASTPPAIAVAAEVAPGAPQQVAAVPPTATEPPASSASVDKPADENQAAKTLDKEIHTAVGNIGPTPGIEVTAAPEGLLVTLMDEKKFGMFAVGSAEPEPELIRTIDAIGKLIGERPGQIVVRGHTDARPFRNKDYDNWRLSTARAHMAYYMLVRGGVPEDRFEKIEGYADHWLKNADDPEAPENRRIEILIREAKP